MCSAPIFQIAVWLLIFVIKFQVERYVPAITELIVVDKATSYCSLLFAQFNPTLSPQH